MAQSNASIENTFGALLIGAFVTMSIYGITTLQTYFYYTSYPNDDRATKSLVACTWLLDTLHVVLMCHGVHFYLITEFGNFAIMKDATWSLFASIAVNLVISLLVQCFFTYRIHKLASVRWRWWISSVIGFTVLAHFCFGLETVVFLFIKKDFRKLKEISLHSAVPFGVFAILSDFFIAIALCILLHSNRTEFKDTNHIINKLIVYAINRCILTSAVAIIEVVLFSVIPNSFYSFAVDFVIGKLYANSFLAALNSRAILGRSSNGYGSSTEVSTSFVATGVTTEHGLGQGVIHVRSRDSVRESRLRGVDTIELEIDVEEKQSASKSSKGVSTYSLTEHEAVPRIGKEN